jgi:hypothetical protein
MVYTSIPPYIDQPNWQQQVINSKQKRVLIIILQFFFFLPNLIFHLKAKIQKINNILPTFTYYTLLLNIPQIDFFASP